MVIMIADNLFFEQRMIKNIEKIDIFSWIFDKVDLHYAMYIIL